MQFDVANIIFEYLLYKKTKTMDAAGKEVYRTPLTKEELQGLMDNLLTFSAEVNLLLHSYYQLIQD